MGFGMLGALWNKINNPTPKPKPKPEVVAPQMTMVQPPINQELFRQPQVTTAANITTDAIPVMTITTENLTNPWEGSVLTQANQLTPRQDAMFRHYSTPGETRPFNYPMVQKELENYHGMAKLSPDLPLTEQVQEIYVQKVRNQAIENGLQSGVIMPGMGCVWMATYNALNVLGDRRHPADIIQWMEMNGGMLLQGSRGAFSQPAERYMRYAGYNARTNYLPRVHTIDNQIRNGDVAILTYMRDDFSGHAVAIQYMGDGRFRVYNEGTLWNNSRGYTDSVEEWIQNEMQQEGSISVVTSLTIINR